MTRHDIIVRTIEVRCLPTSIPKHIDVDVTALAIGRSIHLSEIVLPEGVEKSSAADPTMVACVPPAKEEEAVASLTPSAEPEVLTAKKPAEGEEGAAQEEYEPTVDRGARQSLARVEQCT